MSNSNDDLLDGETWVRILTVQDLLAAERIRDLLRERGIGAVIINDEKYKTLSEEERAKARPEGEGFRLEVPRPLLQKAKRLLEDIYKGKDE